MRPTFVLVHGAFRGGWAWDGVRSALAAAGAASLAPTLTGCEPDSPRLGTHVRLEEWVADVIAAIVQAAELGNGVIVVAHSQAGIPVRVALEQVAAEVRHVVYLDAAVPENGERGVDLNPPGSPAPPDDLNPALWLPARPVGTDQGFNDPAATAFVNEQFVPTPIGPSLDPVMLASASAASVPTTYVFFSKTPATYPCRLTQTRLEQSGTVYETIEAGHDAPLTAPEKVAELLLALS